MKYRIGMGVGVVAVMVVVFFFVERPAAQGGPGCVSVAGDWKISSKIDPGTCEEEIDPANLTGAFKQNGCDVSLDIGVTLKGKATGNRIKLKGEYWWMGTTTKDIDLVVRGDRFTGNGKWTYSILGYSCAGTEAFEGRRVN